MKVHRIVPVVTAKDFEACRKFYVEVLGLKVAMDLGWITTFASPNKPNVQIVMIRNDETAPVTPQVTIEVEDVTALYDSAKDAGAKIVYPLTDEPWQVRRFFIKDPNGIVINVTGRGPRS